MSTDPRAELRALALWHTRRRAVDHVLQPLLEYGPVAVDRVSDRLSELQLLMLDEQRAFDAFVESVGDHQRPEAVVVDMFARRAESDEL